MIVFQVRQGCFGQYGWRTVGFWTWLWAEFDDCVARVVIGSAISIDQIAKPRHNVFEKLVPWDRMNEVGWNERGLYLLPARRKEDGQPTM